MKLAVKAYYRLRPVIPRTVRMSIRRRLMVCQRFMYRSVWPVDPHAGSARPPWTVWPQNRPFALVLTHDVETAAGVEKVLQLADLEEQMGFRSSFNFVPAKYPLSTTLIDELKSRGFEVGVHGLLHDGKLYDSKSVFTERARKINQYLKEWGAVGFRSPSMQHNLDWLHDLEILYDASTFDTDPFEPDNSGMGTIFPFQVNQRTRPSDGYIELPYTLPQDSTLYLFLREQTIDIWKQKTAWIVRQGGMVLMNTHPDYMDFSSDRRHALTYPVRLYREFLEHIRDEYSELYWHVLPREMARFVREQYQTREEVNPVCLIRQESF